MQEHLHLVQPARQRQRAALAFAIDAAAGDGGNRLGGDGRPEQSRRYQRAALAAWKLSDIAELGIERRDGPRGVAVEIEGAGVGENDALLVETQVSGSAHSQWPARASSPPSPSRRSAPKEGGQAEAGRQDHSKGGGRGARRGARASIHSRPGAARLEDMQVRWFRPDQFGDKQGQMHGKRRRETRGCA